MLIYKYSIYVLEHTKIINRMFSTGLQHLIIKYSSFLHNIHGYLIFITYLHSILLIVLFRQCSTCKNQFQHLGL